MEGKRLDLLREQCIGNQVIDVSMNENDTLLRVDFVNGNELLVGTRLLHSGFFRKGHPILSMTCSKISKNPLIPNSARLSFYRDSFIMAIVKQINRLFPEEYQKEEILLNQKYQFSFEKIADAVMVIFTKDWIETFPEFVSVVRYEFLKVFEGEVNPSRYIYEDLVDDFTQRLTEKRSAPKKEIFRSIISEDRKEAGV